jgi:hypothetical protein
MLDALFWRRPTLARPIAVLPSGLQRFTAVFGMGTGGTTALLSPECGTALAVSLLSQRRKREAESLVTRRSIDRLIQATVIDCATVSKNKVSNPQSLLVL